MLITSLLNRCKGFSQYIIENEEQRSFLKLHQSNSFITPHNQPIHSLQQTSQYTIIASCDQITINNYKQTNNIFINQKSVRCHPCLPLTIVLQQQSSKLYYEWNIFESIYSKNPTDVVFLLSNSFALSSEDGVNIFDNQTGKLLGGIVVEANSLGTDGVDVYCGGKSQYCLDMKMFKKRWELPRSGILTMKNGIGIIKDLSTISAIDLNGKYLWTMEKKGVNCVELSDDGQYFLLGYQNGSIDLFQSQTSTQLCTLERLHDEPITAMNWSSSQLQLLTGSKDGLVMRWDYFNKPEIINTDEWE
ncbi:WD domain, G-beta repeat-containing protein [Entamoeba histolytica HM-3:IMSS]|uniref:WD domain containing protein n=3 Tax=Entamoeba histolytica TaxID=5759 RepID=A0A175JZ80_ENTHI|nr:WD domain containing protein [Entamoeba histolytica KU27]EMS14289.1 WD domain, G-beta repeat-containing protein [Entamoeba histolytica HM-3:IMSS]GAT98634.1 WD domain containing protein [Entamoeba histolytica]